MKSNNQNNHYKLLFISHSGRLKGGAQYSLLNILKYLSKQNFDIVVSMPSFDGLEVPLKKLGIKVIKINSFNWNSFKNGNIYNSVKHNIACLIDIFYTMYFIKKYKIDLIITNTVFPFSGAIASKILGKKHLWVIREAINNNYYNFIFKKKTISQLIGKLSDRIISVSDYAKNSSITYNDFHKTSIINNSVNINFFKKVKKKEYSKFFKVGVIGSISPIKHQIKLFELIKFIKDDNIKFYIYGNVPNQIDARKYYEKIVQRLKLEDLKENIFIEKFSPIESILSNLDAVINFCEIESFGRTIIESMAGKRPVISVNSGAAPEIIKSKKNGFLFEKNDYLHINKILIKLKSNEAFYTKTVNSAYEHVEKFYCHKKQGKIYSSEINRLLAIN